MMYTMKVASLICLGFGAQKCVAEEFHGEGLTRIFRDVEGVNYHDEVNAEVKGNFLEITTKYPDEGFFGFLDKLMDFDQKQAQKLVKIDLTKVDYGAMTGQKPPQSKEILLWNGLPTTYQAYKFLGKRKSYHMSANVEYTVLGQLEFTDEGQWEDFNEWFLTQLNEALVSRYSLKSQKEQVLRNYSAAEDEKMRTAIANRKQRPASFQGKDLVAERFGTHVSLEDITGRFEVATNAKRKKNTCKSKEWFSLNWAFEMYYNSNKYQLVGVDAVAGKTVQYDLEKITNAQNVGESNRKWAFMYENQWNCFRFDDEEARTGFQTLFMKLIGGPKHNPMPVMEALLEAANKI